MAKSQSKTGLAASSKELDPTLTALFSGSAGPVVPSKSRYQELLPRKAKPPPTIPESHAERNDTQEGSDEGSEDDSDDWSSSNEEDPSDDDEDESEQDVDGEEDEDEDEAAKILEAVSGLDASVEQDGRKRKRKHRDEDDNLEGDYLSKLQDTDEPAGKRLKDENGAKAIVDDHTKAATEVGKDVEFEDVMEDESSDGEKLVHESLKSNNAASSDIDKANRTAFLSNVSAEAITSSKAKKTLMAHLSSVLDKSASPPETIESIRFRSTAFSTAALPKRAAFAQKSVMDATTKSTNAYVVYSSPTAVRTAVKKLNGTVVLDRHLRVDSVAHPAPQDHKRCVFVGNLGFVNDETVLNTKVDEEGNEITEKRKRTKQPMDVEEGLWRVFSKDAGKVESVRVVRDAATRVGKGIAYVQFDDGNGVEAALLLNGKKFPPMLPRELRVTRCKAPQKTARALEARRAKVQASAKPEKKKGNKYVPKATDKEQSLKGRAGKLLGRAGASKLNEKSGGETAPRLSKKERDGKRDKVLSVDGTATGIKVKAPEAFVFEGRRASAKDGKPKDLKFKGKKSGAGRVQKKKSARVAARTGKWRAAQKGAAK